MSTKISSHQGTFLVLGAGQIGKAIASKLFSRPETKTVIVHTLTAQEAKEAVTLLEHNRPRSVKVVASWGDILGPNITDGESPAPTERQARYFDYYYQPFTHNTVLHSSLYQIIHKWRPEYIIDAINTATIFGYRGKLYEVERTLWNEAVRDDEKPANNNHLTQELLMAAFVPKITRFVQVLESAIREFGVRRYVKVSTTGLGGMGLTIPYTHGDPSEPGISTRLLGKIAAAGILNQLLWNLSHEQGIDARVVVPATLVGWEPLKSRQLQHGTAGNAPTIKVVEHSRAFELAWNQPLAPAAEPSPTPIEIISVGSGENNPYALAEVAAITASHQMGAVTKEEVAEATVETALGSDRHNILAAMDQATLGPSVVGAEQRQTVLELLETLEQEEHIPSIVTGNLGPRVAKHLFELYLLLKVCGERFTKKAELVSKELEAYVGEHSKLRNVTLSLGIPILLKGARAYIGTHWEIPPEYDDQTLTKERLEQWADLGWVDLRGEHIAWWLKILRELPTDQLQTALEHKNLSRRTGELLGLVYTHLGWGRKN